MAAAAKRRWVVTGAGGQLGRCLAERLRDDPANALAAGFDRRALDIGDAAALRRALTALPGGPPDVVANAAAMTQVDRCETELAEAEAANTTGPVALAKLCAELGAR